MIAPPYLRMLTDEEVRRVYQASLQILAQTGMTVEHERARLMLEAAGAQVDHDAQMVRFPPELVEEKLKLVPRVTPYHGRTPDFDFALTLDGDIYGRVAGGATGYIDLHTGKHRRARLADWREFATLVDALPNVNVVATLHCGDVSLKTADIHSLHVLLTSQRKNIVHNAFSAQNLRIMFDMLATVFGSREAVAERPQMHVMLSPISPLYLNADDTEQLLMACEFGLPTDIPIMPTAGTTGPITLAGTLALANAEFLGTMTLAQTARPGHIMPFFVDPVVADMKTGNPLFAAPEIGILVAAISQLGREVYAMPPEGIGLDSDGFTVEQAVFQKCQNTVFQALAGGKLIIGAGLVEASMALDPVQLVIDDEILSIARRWTRGMRVDDETLAVDVIHRVGPRGHFLMEEHTLKLVRSGELIDTKIFDRDRRDVWEMKGSKSPAQKAHEKALSILEKHQVPPLPDAVLRELDRIVRNADAQYE